MDVRRPSSRRRAGAMLASPAPALPKPKRRKKHSKKALKAALVRYLIVSVNLIIVAVAVVLVLKNRGSNAADYALAVNDQVNASPLDQLSAGDIAVNIARMASLPEEYAVTNYADTIRSDMNSFTVTRSFALSSQVMSADIKTLDDIQEYTTVKGDTAFELAERFGITSDSILWSNDLTQNELPAGIHILIPPMNGIIYKVRAGDTARSIAGKFNVSATQVIAFNDAEVTGLKSGMRIFLPNATNPAPRFSFLASYGSNGYDYGYCTYYAAAKANAPSGWGHARTWATGAAVTRGWYVDKTPAIGAIAQTTQMSYWGHVAIVEDVKKEDGQWFIKTSDMNNLAGWNNVGYDEDWRPATDYQAYIHRAK